MKTSLICMVAVAAAIFTPTSRGEIELFNVTWSGVPNGNGATASAIIGIDTALIPNPGSDLSGGALPPWLDSITLTVSGASAGNGTFTLADFTGAVWSTGGATLNLQMQLIGQATGTGTWGTISGLGPEAGDFNLFTFRATEAPSGSQPFQFQTNGGVGDALNLVSFAPVPEPGTYALLGVGAAAIFLLRRRRR